jgi:hypothetical protein
MPRRHRSRPWSKPVSSSPSARERLPSGASHPGVRPRRDLPSWLILEALPGMPRSALTTAPARPTPGVYRQYGDGNGGAGRGREHPHRGRVAVRSETGQPFPCAMRGRRQSVSRGPSHGGWLCYPLPALCPPRCPLSASAVGCRGLSLRRAVWPGLQAHEALIPRDGKAEPHSWRVGPFFGCTAAGKNNSLPIPARIPGPGHAGRTAR